MSDELKTGAKHELEHTKSKKVAKKIAKDHLKDDPKYYTKLKKAGLEESKRNTDDGYVSGQGKWNYPKDMTKTKETSDMGTTNAASNRKARKMWRKKVKQEKIAKKIDESILGAMAVGAAVGTLPYIKYGKKRKSVADRLMDTHQEKSYQKSKIKQSDGYLKKSKNPKTLDKYTKQKTDAEDKLKKTSYIKSLFKEATLGGAARVGKSNPNNVKSKKSGFTINTKMNDAYSKVPDAKGLVRKRLLQKGKAAWNVGHAKKLAEEENLQELSRATLKSYLKKNNQKARNASDKKNFEGPDALEVGSKERNLAAKKSSKRREGSQKAYQRLGGEMTVKPQKKAYGLKEENLQELSKNPVAQKAKSYSNGYRRKADNAFDRGDDAEMERQNDKADNAQKRYKSAMRKNLQELSKDTLKSYVKKATQAKDQSEYDADSHATGDFHGGEKSLKKTMKDISKRTKGIKTAKDKIWRKNAQDEYDGPNRDGKKASDGVRYTGD
jgi:hypothetical protein